MPNMPLQKNAKYASPKKCLRFSSHNFALAIIATIGHTQLWSTANFERCVSQTITFKLEGRGHLRLGEIFVTPFQRKGVGGGSGGGGGGSSWFALMGIGEEKGKKGKRGRGGKVGPDTG